MQTIVRFRTVSLLWLTIGQIFANDRGRFILTPSLHGGDPCHCPGELDLSENESLYVKWYARPQDRIFIPLECIGVILGGTRGTRTSHFLKWGVPYSHFLRAVTRSEATVSPSGKYSCDFCWWFQLRHVKLSAQSAAYGG